MTDEREKKTIETTQRTVLEEAMVRKDEYDRGILMVFGNLWSPPKAAPSLKSLLRLLKD
jgi:hypothetical protein